MKKLILLLTIIFIAASTFAQAPEKMSYQAVVRKATGELVSEKLVGIRISILKGTSTGTLVFSQAIKKPTNENGLVTFAIGAVGVTYGALSEIAWDSSLYFLKTEIDPDGDNAYSITNTSQIMSVPYALYAKSSGGNTLDKTYRTGTNAEKGKINADIGPVIIEGSDGFLVSGVLGKGAIIPKNTGSGYISKMYFNPRKAAFRAGNVYGETWDDANIGDESAAFGRSNRASGGGSFATGVGTKATGFSSLATGNGSEASGYAASALGIFAIASGYGAVALGRGVASGEYSTTLGFRTKAIGNMSVAMGDSSEAKGTGSMAFGHNNIATGPYSTAIGYNNKTLGNYATAIGYGCIATKAYGVSMGFQNEASGYYEGSTALGYQTTASGDGSTAIGRGSVASGKWSTSIGRFNHAVGESSFAIGNNSFVNVVYSASIGTGNTVNSKKSIAIGSGITIPAGFDGTIVMGDDNPGREMSGSLTKNSFAGRFSGGARFYTNPNLNVGVTLNGGGNSWSTWSDSTLKENFLPVDGKEFLSKISDMKLVSWNYKSQNPAEFRHYGPMAQDFYNSFGKDKLGIIGNDTMINQADFMGVNLIAIQALIKENKEIRNQLATMEKSMASLKENNETLKTTYTAILAQYESTFKKLEAKYEILNKSFAGRNVQTTQGSVRNVGYNK